MPRPCTAPGCTYAHNRATAAAEYEALLKEEAALMAVQTKAGKSKFSKWRTDFSTRHFNVQPGDYGKPMFHHHMNKQILDPLHYAELGIQGWAQTPFWSKKSDVGS